MIINTLRHINASVYTLFNARIYKLQINAIYLTVLSYKKTEESYSLCMHNYDTGITSYICSKYSHECFNTEKELIKYLKRS